MPLIGATQKEMCMSHHVASCCCGALKVTCAAEPVRVSICHCLECQRRTGSAFSYNARFDGAAVTVEGPSATYTRQGDSGKMLHFHFCPACGSTVYWLLDAAPGVMAVAAGAFADPSFMAPRVSVYEQRKHNWVQLPDTIAEHIS
jgi:hypothetical protein